MGRLVTLVAVAVSLVGFIAGVTGSTEWWVGALNRGGYVLVVLAVVAALMGRRSASLLVVGAEVIATAAALAFVVVGLVKYYEGTSPFGGSLQTASTWLGEAEMLSVAVLAFGLTLARQRNAIAVGALAGAVAATVGCAIYAITLKGNFAAYVWWSVAVVLAFLAAAAAAGLEREGTVALDAPVPSSAGGEPGSDPGVE